jgi:hypothetical protein
MTRPANIRHGQARPRPIRAPWLLIGIMLGMAVACIAAGPSLGGI